MNEDQLLINLERAGVTKHWVFLLTREIRERASSRRAQRRTGVFKAPYLTNIRYSAFECYKKTFLSKV